MILFYQPRVLEGVNVLEEEESRHCVKVLRKSAGDAIRITDGKGHFVDATIAKADARACSFTIDRTLAEPARNFRIHLAISPTKNSDRIEWMVEKCVEIGIEKITLIACEHTERSFQKTERLTKVAISAMKQSLKARLPELQPLTPLDQFLRDSYEPSKFIAYVDAENPTHLMQAANTFSDALILIGPEGDFTESELNLALTTGFTKVSLGPSRLRTETAGVVACTMLNALKI